MSVTARDIARELGLSPAAVSMALNNRPGVSAATRKLVYDTAEKLGYDLSRHLTQTSGTGSIYFICVQTSSAIFSYAPIFDEILRGAVQECQATPYRMKVQQFYAQQDTLEQQISDLRVSDCTGIILLGTEMNQDVALAFLSLRMPVIVVDSNVEPLDCSCVVINNTQGAYQATGFLIKRCMSQPGYLRSAYPIGNFNERANGFYQAIRDYGMSPSKSVVHLLSPAPDGAYADMCCLLEQQEELACCYFADNDAIACAAMRALQEHGYRIPEDISIIGFDDIPVCGYVVPALTTVRVSKRYLGNTAVSHLIRLMEEKTNVCCKIEISTELVVRGSVR